MNEFYKEIFSAVAIAINIFAFFPYIRSIRKGRTKPHVFSWVIWGSTTSIVFLAQLEDKGGIGAWPIGISGVITLYVAFLAYIRKSDISITRIDWALFLMAMSSLPLWFLTSNPFWAVIILTTVDVVGFAPTIRKAYHHPYDEQKTFFVLIAVRNVLVLFALENCTVTTMLFPAVISVACLFVITLIIYRRREQAM